MHNLNSDGKVTTEILKAADNETLNGIGVDMLGYNSVMFIAGALAGEALAFSLKAQQDTVVGFGSTADLKDTAVSFSTTTTLNGQAILDIHQPTERYVRPVVVVPDAAAATPVFCVAIRYNAKSKPVANSNVEQYITPAEGTA